MKLDWTWEIDSNGDLYVEITQGDKVVLEFTLDEEQFTDSLEEDLVLEAQEGDYTLRSEWRDLAHNFRKFATMIEERIR